MKIFARTLWLAFLLSAVGMTSCAWDHSVSASAAPSIGMSHSGSTQAPPVTPPTRGLPYRVKRISSEQGLSSTDVQNVLRDRQGFLWFGTLDGLNRYDGYKMKVFKNTLTDPTSLSERMQATVMPK